MRLPGPKSTERQGTLFHADKLLTSGGMARWATGQFFEDATRSASGAVRLRTDASCDICPDLRYDQQTFFETKGVGRGASVIFYECRFHKDRRFMESTGNQIVYWFWHHTYPVLQAESYDVLYAGLARSTKRLLIVDHDLLARFVTDKPTRKVNSAYTESGDRLGYGENGYGIGWTLRLSWFAERCERLFSIMRLSVGKREFPVEDVEVYVSRPEFGRYVNPPGRQLVLDFE